MKTIFNLRLAEHFPNIRPVILGSTGTKANVISSVLTQKDWRMSTQGPSLSQKWPCCCIPLCSLPKSWGMALLLERCYVNLPRNGNQIINSEIWDKDSSHNPKFSGGWVITVRVMSQPRCFCCHCVNSLERGQDRGQFWAGAFPVSHLPCLEPLNTMLASLKSSLLQKLTVNNELLLWQSLLRNKNPRSMSCTGTILLILKNAAASGPLWKFESSSPQMSQQRQGWQEKPKLDQK